jgi:protein-disulfide isomerase
MTLARRALTGLALTLTLAGCQKTEDAAFGERVRAYLLEHPEVIREAALKLTEKEQLAAAKAAGDAIGKHRAALERDPRDFVANPNGKITVVEFYDYRCGYCKVAAPEIVTLIRQNPDVRFVFKELPIFGDVSDTAARIALTAPAKARGLDLYGRWMEEKSLDDAALDRHLREAGLDPAQARQAARSPEIARHIADTRTLAQALKIEGTPAFIVGETMIPGADLNALRVAITQARAADLKRPA